MEIMTPKEKAKELIEKFKNADFNCKGCDMVFCDVPCTMLNLSECKKCALICVDEIIKANPYSEAQKYIPAHSTIKYWQEVREEILKL